ncbi:hypothetical protein AVEN_225793-1 [Araneus ventricosus]|uniref:Uncharacterized protein n=1 Tax=Araneus ventricosus TaxID=182803 RepID=A0A4Y2BCP8_ARAVE|nr:hypothetical protein AVEN_225793-1 [Araneus ventricosus]
MYQKMEMMRFLVLPSSSGTESRCCVYHVSVTSVAVRAFEPESFGSRIDHPLDNTTPTIAIPPGEVSARLLIRVPAVPPPRGRQQANRWTYLTRRPYFANHCFN